MNNLRHQLIRQNINNSCGGYVLIKASQDKGHLPAKWDKYFSKQSLKAAQPSEQTAFRVVVSNLPQTIPSNLSNTLLEQLAWGLLTRPDCQVIVQPLYVSLNLKHPATITQCYSSQIHYIINNGFIALMRYHTFKICSNATSSTGILKLAVVKNMPIKVVSRALLKEEAIPDSILNLWYRSICKLKHHLGMWHHLSNLLKNHLSIEQRKWIKRQLVRFRNLSTKTHIEQPFDDICLAKKTAWEPAFLCPEVAVRIPKHGNRIPVLMAVHWLELGGAEKFAINLIKALPKSKYAIYVTTDVPSENQWHKEINESVEEIFHLPEFLQRHKAGIFYEYYIRTRGIRLLHIHHAPWAYESLLHIRRFHPDLKVLNTLHILELPPHSGGYPEFAASNFEPFIDNHHVTSKRLKKFLIQRWLIPQEKVHVIYTNENTNHFDPDNIEGKFIRSKYAIPDTACLIGFVGRLTRQKQPLVFVQMAKLLIQRWKDTKQHKELHFVMVGSGPLLKKVQKIIDKCSLLHSVHLHDEVIDVRQIYKDCDLLVIPSENEGLALVTYEAMAMKLPVFFTDVGAQSELLKPEFLVPNEDPVAPKIAQAVWPFLLDKDLRRRVGEESRSYILKHHRADLTFTKMFELYQRLLTNTME